MPRILSAESALLVRPQGGYGYLDANGGTALAHVGMRVLMPASEKQRYGLELTHFVPEKAANFTSLGIVLEQRMWECFNMSIGTVGYLGYNGNSLNPFGLMTNLGWEPKSKGRWEPFITYRNDLIFSGRPDSLYSLSVGVSFKY
ncbi:MAG: hypothetical protein WCG61_03165 [Chlorobium sp.]